MLKDLVLKNRSRRRFHQDAPVDMQTLRELVDLARLSASGGNRQGLKYALSCDPETNSRIFPLIGLAGDPTAAEAPAAYIVILGDREIASGFGCDHGIAAQSIMLGAAEKGLGGCMVGIIDRKKLRQVLQLPDRYQILLVLILGKPKEEAVIVPLPETGEASGWWDEQGVRHVPKRSLDDLVVCSRG